MRFGYLIITGIFLEICYAGDDGSESDGDTSRKILGSSVVTSVSVVMDTGNKKNTIYTDAVGKLQSKPSNPSELASPIDLLNPDRYEFYTFDDNGDLVKRLMSLEEIKSIIATGDSDALDFESFTAQGFLPEKRVSDVVNNVQSVLKEEMEILKDPITKPIFDTPDVSDSWSMILPAIFGNSGEDIKPERPAGYVTPDTIMLEPNSQVSHSTSGPQKVDIILSSLPTTKSPPISTMSTKRPSSISTPSSTHISQPVYYSSSALFTTKTMSPTTEPSLNVEIIANSVSSTTDINLPKEAITEVKTEQVPTILPTRLSILPSTRPQLIRNITITTNSQPATTQTASSTHTISTSAKPQTAAISSSSVRPTTQKITSTSQEVPIHSTSLKSTTTQWTSTSYRPSSTQLSSTSYKTTAVPSSTSKPVPNIFGFPAHIEKNPVKSTSTVKPTRSPISNIFGLPVTQKTNPPTTSVASATFTVPVKSTSTIGTTVSQININPQLSTTSTFGNVYPNSIVTKVTSPKTTTEKILEKITLSTEKQTLNSANGTKPSTWAPRPEDQQLFNVFKEILGQTKVTTENSIPDATDINNALSFESNKIQSTDPSEDLSTLSTENLQQNFITTTESDNEQTTTKLPPLLNSLNDKQKLSASELLDQLLLTTNIYEINTELASSKLNTSDTDIRFDNADNNSTLDDQQMTTTDHNIISYSPTTDITLIQSIEQLLSQAVGDVHSVLNQTTDRVLLTSPSDTTMNLIKEAETEASDVTVTSTEPELIATSTENNDHLNNSVQALLSQVNDEAASLNRIVFTEKPNIQVTYRKNEETKATVTPKTSEQKSTVTPQQSSQTEHKEAEEESSTIYYVIKKNPKITTTEETTSQHLINITVLSTDETRNKTKPAKADLSLEQEIIAEEMKNITLLHDSSTTNRVESNELLKGSETSAVIINSTSLTNKTYETSSPKDLTTPEINTDTTAYPENKATQQYLTTTAELETTTNDLRFADGDETTTDTLTTENSPVKSSTIQYSQKVSTIPKPSIVITINENNTIVTESGKLVANKTISNQSPLATKEASTLPPPRPQKNSTQDQTWTLVSTVAPQHASNQNLPPPTIPYPEVIDTPVPVDLVPKPMQGFGLEDTTSTLDVDVHQFAQLCNELAFGFWKTVTTGLSSARSIFVSPFAATSMLAMVFLGAKGATSEEMNEILKLDDMVTFNPHLTFKTVSESLISEPNSGVATTAMVRELFSDRSKGKLLDFYKNRVRAFYDGFVEEVSYREIGDVIRRRTNLLVKKYTNNKYPQFLNDASITARPPLSGVSVNIFETDCSQTSSEGRDGELHFIVLPSIKQRRLVPIPAVVYKSGFLAGYEPSLDATAVALGSKDQVASTILVIPGQQGIAFPGDGLARLEKRLVESSFKKGAWSRLLRSLIPRPGLEVQVPRFSHRSVINATNTLQRMGLHELFNPESADLRGLNGVANELHLSDVLQINKFATCGDIKGDDTHHSEVYPATTMRARAARRLQPIAPIDQEEPRDYQRAFHDPLYDPLLFGLPLSLRPRQARIPDVPRLRFDRPFLYFVRHNPTGLILHMGRFNPRLLP